MVAVLEGCGFEPREADEPHEAGTDALHAGRVYMKLVQMPEPNKSHLGFLTEPDAAEQEKKDALEEGGQHAP